MTSQLTSIDLHWQVSAPEGKAQAAAGPGTMMLSVDGTINAYENLQEQRERVEQIFNLPCGSECEGWNALRHIEI